MLITGFLVNCGSSASSNSSLNSSISFNQTSVIVAQAGYTEVLLTLNNPQSISESFISVKLISSDPKIATASTNEDRFSTKCILNLTNHDCTVIIEGISKGSATISASADGYIINPLSVSVDSNVVISGTINLHSPDNQPLYVTKGSTNLLSVSLDDSTGVYNLAVTASSSNPNVATVTPDTCNLSSGINRTCIFTVNGLATGPVSITASAPGYSSSKPVQVNIGNEAQLGIIAFSRLGHNGLPESLSQVNIPPNPSLTTGLYFYESLSIINSSGIESVLVMPEPQVSGNNMVTFPNNLSVILSSTMSTLTIQGMVWQGYTSGDDYIIESSTFYTTASGIINSALPNVITHFHIVPTITPATRTITFVNNCQESVWIGVTSSSAKAIDINGDAHTYCDPDGILDKCPTGSSCLFAESSGGNKLYSCYWNAPANPQNKYILNSGESVVTYVESSWYDKTADVQWSGNFFGRTKCDPTTGFCQTGNCKIANQDSKACVVNVGASPQPVTLAEITMQPDTVDSYDVSAIPGVNLPMSFGPDSNSNPTVNNYSCGTGGAIAVQGNLNAAPWTFPSKNFANESIAYFSIVESGGAPCTPGIDTCSSGKVCGMTFASVAAVTFTTSCGSLLAYVTPNGVATIQPGSTTATPPYYNASPWSYQALPSQNNWSLYQLNLCQTDATNCESGTAGTINTGYGPYQCNGQPMYTESANTCGCTNWTGIATPTQNCSSDNPAWEANVKPYINFIKLACPTCYSYPYDDKSSSYSCKVPGDAASQYVNTTNYVVTYCPAGTGL